MAIYQAISKYGLDKFTLEILEYCNKDVTIERVQFYLDKIQPEYNLLKKAGSIFGFKHNLLSLNKMSDSALGRIVSEETRLKKVKHLKVVVYLNLQKKRLEAIDILNKLKPELA